MAEHLNVLAAFAAVVVDNLDLLLRAALDGAGLAFTFEQLVAPHLASAALVRVLDEWCPSFPGYFFFTPAAGSSRARWRP